MPAVASVVASNCSREKRSPSAVPCTSTIPPLPVSTKFGVRLRGRGPPHNPDREPLRHSKDAGDRRDLIRKGNRLDGSDALQVLESEMECDETAGDGRRPRAAICL